MTRRVIHIRDLKPFWRPWFMRVVGLRVLASVGLTLFPLVVLADMVVTMIRERHEYHELWVIFWRILTGQVEYRHDDDERGST